MPQAPSFEPSLPVSGGCGLDRSGAVGEGKRPQAGRAKQALVLVQQEPLGNLQD